MKALLEYLVKNIVSQPEKVTVTQEEDESVNLSLQVAPDEVGRVIGRSGKTIRSLRSLLYLKATLLKKRVNLRLVETESEEAPLPQETK